MFALGLTIVLTFAGPGPGTIRTPAPALHGYYYRFGGGHVFDRRLQP